MMDGQKHRKRDRQMDRQIDWHKYESDFIRRCLIDFECPTYLWKNVIKLNNVVLFSVS